MKNKAAAAPAESEHVVADDADGIIRQSVAEVSEAMRLATKIYDRTMIAVFKETRKALREAVQQSDELYDMSKQRKKNIMSVLSNLKDNEIAAAYYYAQAIDYITEIARSLRNITHPCFEHIDNNHEGMTKEQIDDLMRINDDVEIIFARVNIILQRNDFSETHLVVELRDALFEAISEAMTNQLRSIKHKESSTKASMLYITILNETKTMVLHTRNLIKSQRYFVQHK